MSSNPSPQQVKEMEAALKKAALDLQNKEKARLQLLAIQSLLARTHPINLPTRKYEY